MHLKRALSIALETQWVTGYVPFNARLILSTKPEVGVLLVLGIRMELIMGWMCFMSGWGKWLRELVLLVAIFVSRRHTAASLLLCFHNVS